MAERVYEGMFLLDANKYARDSGGVSGKVNEMIEKCGGEVLVSRVWAEQKLAYPIEGHRKGAYWLAYFKIDSLKIPELRRAAKLTPEIVRELMIVIDPRLVDTLVAHATAGQPAAFPPKESSSSAEQPKPAAEPAASTTAE